MLIALLKLLLKIKKGDKSKGSEGCDRTEVSMADILSASNSMNFDIDLKAFEQHLGEVSLLRQSAVDAPYSSLSLHNPSYLVQGITNTKCDRVGKKDRVLFGLHVLL